MQYIIVLDSELFHKGSNLMKQFARPILVLSQCIEFDHCRWDGHMITSHFVRDLKPYVEFITVCPEVEIGLGIPRRPLRIISKEGELRLVQPATALDVTDKMNDFVSFFLESLPPVDGFILKNRSPTSALKDAKIYYMGNGVASVSRGPGFFGREVLKRFAHLPIEDEGRLRNARIKEHFLIRVFTTAAFRELKSSGKAQNLTGFTTNNELLFQNYNSPIANELKKLSQEYEASLNPDIIQRYEAKLRELLQKPPTCKSTAETILQIMSRFSDRLTIQEQELFRSMVQEYHGARSPVSVPIGTLRSWIARFQDDYLANQSFFEPHPRDLADIETMTSYCDGKDYWSLD